MGEVALPNATTWRWTREREVVALALAEGKSWNAIHQEYGVAKTTIARWLKAPEFQERIDEHLAEVKIEAQRILKRNAAAAAQKLVHLMESGHSIHTVRLAATKDLLDRVGIKEADTRGTSDTTNVSTTVQVAVVDYRTAIAPVVTVSEPAQNGHTLLVQGEHPSHDPPE